MLYEFAKVTSIFDPEDKGRVQVSFLRNELELDWIPLVDSLFSKGDNGWDGELEENDIVIISFFDYPDNQKPFVFGKPKSKNQTSKRDGKETLKIKGHKVIFDNDSVTIQNKNGLSEVKINESDIEIKAGSEIAFTAVRWETLQAWLSAHTHVGNLSFPTSPPIVPPLPAIQSPSIKIS